ncbi:MAG: UDP-N-acetylenolpyruvoylglucosamine reductase [Candidatus Melainabacteria bacterium RIFCSPLOWO2_02_FULL_35_15]|nr:MAG: UDP-N-acetylenolpyruvoylglucosamine reductase [Candidatus Melainabacteria bacterium RIFCSPLOWO2_12_FULL_35_11]OGI13536.1 MAG: UDP-N-acetylenolpyruvoylglucosamine reductase [Candidatus Melainabacteria bacterium RIFCSPLOWO2_02_FULL_35_15]
MKTLEKTELGQFTTMKIGGVADKICFPSTIRELIDLIDKLMSKNEPWSLVGGGSNILASSQNIPGTVICTTGLNLIEQLGPDLLIAGAGVRLPRLSAYASKLSLSGMEFFEGIPGTVGGAVVMNAGAHGHSTNQILETVTVLDLKKGKVEVLTLKDIIFGYRISTINPQEQIVLSAKFRMVPDTEAAIRTRMKANNLARRSSQPIKDPSAGCTFKNPIELNMPAGKILDSIGAKNWTIGAAQVSSIHANFIINLGSADSQDVCKLISKMQESTFEKYNILLKPEIKPLGVFKESEAIIWTNADQTTNSSFIITK